MGRKKVPLNPPAKKVSPQAVVPSRSTSSSSSTGIEQGGSDELRVAILSRNETVESSPVSGGTGRSGRTGRIAAAASPAGNANEKKATVASEKPAKGSKKAAQQKDFEKRVTKGSESTLQKKSPESPKHDVRFTATKNETRPWMICTASSHGTMLSNEVRVSASVLADLHIFSGSLVELRDEHCCVYAEALFSHTLKGATIQVSEEVAAGFKSADVEVRSAPREIVEVVEREAARSVVLHATMNADESFHAVFNSNPSSDVNGSDIRISDARIAAAFRRAYRGRLVYAGMTAALRITTQQVFAEVVRIDWTEGRVEKASNHNAKVSCLLDDSTSIMFGRRANVEGGGASSESAGVSASAEEKLTTAQLEEEVKPALFSLIVGDSGTGKSRRLRRDAEELARVEGRRVVALRAEDLAQGEGSEVTSAVVLHEWMEAARAQRPSLVLLDDLHLVCGREGTSVGSRWAMTHLAAMLCRELDTLRAESQKYGAMENVRVLATAPSLDSLDSALCTVRRLGERVVCLQPPATAAERLHCLRDAISEGIEEENMGTLSSDVLERIAEESHGFTQRDLAKVVATGIALSFQDTAHTTLTDACLLKAAKTVRPSVLRTFEVSVPKMSWNDIGGSGVAKRTLQECVEWCLGKQRWIFQQFKLSPPKGVLLYGPPGCSKTMLAKALANESKMNFISVKGPEVFSKWVGDSEKAVRDIFERARAAAPCVVFIDELDGMCTHRGRGGVTDRVISQFLTELDGLPAAFNEKSDAVILVAATNRPDNIDNAVLRPGRIDRKVYVGLPEMDEREAIVRLQLVKLPVESDVTPQYVASRTQGYSGAEVVAVCKEAAFHAVMANLRAETVTCADVDAALMKVRPRISERDVLWYKHWGQRSDSTLTRTDSKR